MKFQFLPFWLVLALSSFQSNAAPADAKQVVPDGSYVLASENPDIVPGRTMENTGVMTMEGGKFSMETPQGKIEGTVEMTTTTETRTKALTPEKVSVLTKKNETIRKMTMNDQVLPGAPEVKPLVDVPVVVTLSKGKWTAAREDGAEATTEEAADLKHIARNVSHVTDRAMYGTQPRKPGDQWKVDAKDSLFSGDDGIKDPAGTVELTFDKVGDYEGMKCAYLSGTVEISGKMAKEEKGSQGKVSMTGTVAIIRSLELGEDLLAEMKGKIEMKMEMPAGTMNMSGPMTMKYGTTIVK